MLSEVGSHLQTVEKTSEEPGKLWMPSAADPDFAGWGYWNTGRVRYGSLAQGLVDDSGASEEHNEGVHYIVGRPTPTAAMPVTGSANYLLIGGTASTANDDGSLRVWHAAGAGLNVDFGAARVNAFVNTVFRVDGQDVPVQIARYGYTDEGSGFYSDVWNGYYYGDGGSFYGFFIGGQATRAGLVYQGYDGSVGVVRRVPPCSSSRAPGLHESAMSAMFTSTDEYVHDYYPRGGLMAAAPASAISSAISCTCMTTVDSYDYYGYGGGSSYLSTSGP